MSSSYAKRNLFIIAILAALAAVAATVVILGRSQDSTVNQQVQQVSVEGVGVPEGKQPFSGMSTLKALASDGKDLECQVIYERSSTEGNIEGTYFASQGNFRGDFMVPAPEFGGKIVSSMIVGGSSMYVWSKINNDTFGFKSDLAAVENKQIDTKEPVPLDAEVKYTCTEWTSVDGSVFVPPAEVTFKDLAPVIKAGMEDGMLPR